MADAIRWNCRIQITSEDKTPRSSLLLRVSWRGFSPSTSISSSITRLGVILCLHLSSLLFKFFIYCCLLAYGLESSSGDCASFTLVPHLDKLE